MDAKEYVQNLVDKGRAAQAIFETYSQEEVDACVRAIGKVVADNAALLAREAVEETGMGVYEDKIAKNSGKAKAVWYRLKGVKSRGIIRRDEKMGIVEVAKPKGVIGSITPTTNPTMTPMQNGMVALKGGNAILVCPHPRSKKVSMHTCELMRGALRELGAPEDLIQCIPEPTLETSGLVMALTDVCIATGGSAMVKAAFSSGRPAYGVGPGNVQCLIDRDADLNDAIPKLAKGRIYDNGILCTCEQAVIAPREKYDEVIDRLVAEGGCYVDDPDALRRLRGTIFPGGTINKDVVGAAPQKIGEMAGVRVPHDARFLVVKAEAVGAPELFNKEKMCPVLVAHAYDTWEDAVAIARANLDIEGKGHSVVIHSFNKEHVEYVALHINVSRFLVRQIGSNGLGGTYYNGLNPSATMGCGSWSGSSISENLWWDHLVNITRIAYLLEDFVTPTDEEVWGS